MRILQDYNTALHSIDFLKQYDSDMNFTVDNFDDFFNNLDSVVEVLDNILYRPRLLTLKESSIDYDMLKLVCDTLQVYDIVFDSKDFDVLRYIVIPDDIKIFYNADFKIHNIKKLRYYTKIKNISDINKLKDIPAVIYLNSDLLSKKSIMRILSQKFKFAVEDNVIQYIVLYNTTENNINKFISDFSALLLSN